VLKRLQRRFLELQRSLPLFGKTAGHIKHAKEFLHNVLCTASFDADSANTVEKVSRRKAFLELRAVVRSRTVRSRTQR
jgi:hypothetical protein